MSSFEDHTREVLNQSTEHLDARIRSRLTQARYAAVEEARKQRAPFTAWRTWMPVGGMAAAALAVFLWSGSLHQGDHPAQAQSPFEDLDLIATDENLEMMEEVEFYAWMDSDGTPIADNGIG